MATTVTDDHASLGTKASWARAILAADSWAANAGESFRVMDNTGKEQKPGGKRARSLIELAELAQSDSDLSDLHLVVPNHAAACALEKCSAVSIREDLMPISALEGDCGNDELALALAPAYKISRCDGKLEVSGKSPVAQALFSVANNVNVMSMVLQLFNNNRKVQEIAATSNYGVIGHIAYMLANTWNTADEVYVKISSSWGQIEDLTPSLMSNEKVAAIAEAYAGIDTDFKALHDNELKQDQNKVSAVLSNVGTESVAEAH